MQTSNGRIIAGEKPQRNAKTALPALPATGRVPGTTRRKAHSQENPDCGYRLCARIPQVRREGPALRPSGDSKSPISERKNPAVGTPPLRQQKAHGTNSVPWLPAQGVDLLTVKELLGHSSIAMTMRYAYPRGKNLRRAVDLLAPVDGHQMDTRRKIAKRSDLSKYSK